MKLTTFVYAAACLLLSMQGAYAGDWTIDPNAAGCANNGAGGKSGCALEAFYYNKSTGESYYCIASFVALGQPQNAKLFCALLRLPKGGATTTIVAANRLFLTNDYTAAAKHWPLLAASAWITGDAKEDLKACPNVYGQPPFCLTPTFCR